MTMCVHDDGNKNTPRYRQLVAVQYELTDEQIDNLTGTEFDHLLLPYCNHPMALNGPISKIYPDASKDGRWSR